MGMAAILFNGAEPFEQLAIPFQPKAPCDILLKIPQAVSEKTTFKNYTILYMYIPGARADNPQGTKF